MNERTSATAIKKKKRETLSPKVQQTAIQFNQCNETRVILLTRICLT